MKRMALIAVLLLILTLLPAALADTQPSVSFTTNQIIRPNAVIPSR